VKTCGCSSISLNKFLVPPLVAYLPDEASRIYSELIPGYLSLLIKFLEAYVSLVTRYLSTSAQS